MIAIGLHSSRDRVQIVTHLNHECNAAIDFAVRKKRIAFDITREQATDVARALFANGN